MNSRGVLFLSFIRIADVQNVAFLSFRYFVFQGTCPYMENNPMHGALLIIKMNFWEHYSKYISILSPFDTKLKIGSPGRAASFCLVSPLINASKSTSPTCGIMAATAPREPAGNYILKRRDPLTAFETLMRSHSGGLPLLVAGVVVVGVLAVVFCDDELGSITSSGSKAVDVCFGGG